MEKQWTQIGELNGRPIYQSEDGRLAIERAFEILCELSAEEFESWNQQAEQNQNDADPTYDDSSE